jgi:hypothetical protein
MVGSNRRELSNQFSPWVDGTEGTRVMYSLGASSPTQTKRSCVNGEYVCGRLAYSLARDIALGSVVPLNEVSLLRVGFG